MNRNVFRRRRSKTFSLIPPSLALKSGKVLTFIITYFSDVFASKTNQVILTLPMPFKIRWLFMLKKAHPLDQGPRKIAVGDQ